MNCSRTKPARFWRGMGQQAARRKMALSVVLTGKKQADAWIREGYGHHAFTYDSEQGDPCLTCGALLGDEIHKEVVNGPRT